MNNGAHNSRLIMLDCLKGISVIFVILTHVQLTNEQKMDIMAPYWIWIAVPVFMVISGINFSGSIEKTKDTLNSWFYKTVFWGRLKRFLYPFLVVEVIEILWMKYRNLPSGTIVSAVLKGGLGPGGYYNSMIFQMLIIFPLINKTIKHKPWSLWIFILFNILYEVVCTVLSVPASFYRLCILRYIGALAVGCSMYNNRVELFMENDPAKRSFLPEIMSVAGAVFLYATCYGGYQRVLFLRWHTTSLYSIPYAFGIICFALRYENRLKPITVKLLSPVATVGKASYHIFLMQMLYFDSPISKTIYRNMKSVTGGGVLSILIDIFVCVSAGLLYYKMMMYVRETVNNTYSKGQ